MNKAIKKFAILAGIFLAAAGIYFFTSLNNMEQSETVYTVMDAPELPVIEAELFEDQANRLVGYTQDMGNEVARDSLTILPEDRQLKLRLKYNTETPLSTSYEIRSLDKQRLVEKTEAGQWQTAEDGTEELTLPIQNLLTRGTEYLLHVTMDPRENFIIIRGFCGRSRTWRSPCCSLQKNFPPKPCPKPRQKTW